MRLSKKIAMGAGALTVGLGLLSVLGVGSAVAKSTPTGTVTCTGLTGSIKFSPPMTNTGTKPEKATISVKLSNCTGGTPDPTGGTVTTSFSAGTNNCSAIAKPNPNQAETMDVKWSPSSDGSSDVALGPVTPLTSPAIGFKLTGTGVTGSYTTATGKASFTSYTNVTSTSTLLADCGSTKGLAGLTFTSGTAVA